jgi:hypothetical protein
MRGFIGEYDRDFVEARIAEVRDLLADESLADAAVAVERVGTVDGYRVWSATYDGRNSAFDFDRLHHRHHRPSPVLRPGRCGGPQRRGADRDRPAAVHPQSSPGRPSPSGPPARTRNTPRASDPPARRPRTARTWPTARVLVSEVHLGIARPSYLWCRLLAEQFGRSLVQTACRAVRPAARDGNWQQEARCTGCCAATPSRAPIGQTELDSGRGRAQNHSTGARVA